MRDEDDPLPVYWDCSVDGHLWGAPTVEDEGMQCRYCGMTEAEDHYAR